MSVIPTLRKVRQEDHQFEINRHFIASPCPESKRQTIERNPNGTIQITSRQTRKVSQCPCRVSFLNRYLYLLNVFILCVWMGVFVPVYTCAGQKRLLNPLKLEVLIVVSHRVGVLRSSARTRALNH